MITSTIGRQFLNAYNKKYGQEYDATTFFDKIFYPLFYEGKKYMMTGGNSPFENPKIKWDDMLMGKKEYETAIRKKERYETFKYKVDNNEADASIAIGYPSLDIAASTSGQISNMNINTSKEDIYLSWIGAGLGVGVKGGYCILFTNSQILLDIFEGWSIYHKMLEETDKLKGNQITTWNGQWLAHRYEQNYNHDYPMDNFSPYEFSADGIQSITMQTWTEILIGISQQIEEPQEIGYIYNFGQTNSTIGFIPFSLKSIKKTEELYKKIFGDTDIQIADKLYGTAFGMKEACKEGSIGIKALEPKGLRKYIEGPEKPTIKKDDEKQRIEYNTYIIWLIAMLNNEEIWDIAQNFAEELQKYSLSGTNGKKNKSNEVEEILKSVNKIQFINSMGEIIKDVADADKMTETTKMVNAMPTENVPYFMTLVKFHYARINNTK